MRAEAVSMGETYRDACDRRRLDGGDLRCQVARGMGCLGSVFSIVSRCFKGRTMMRVKGTVAQILPVV